MSKKNISENAHDDGTYVVKKTRKSSVAALIVCLLVAFIIWCYAKTVALKEQAEEQSNGGNAQVSDTVSAES